MTMHYRDGSHGRSPSVERWYDMRFGEQCGMEWPETVIAGNIHRAIASLQKPPKP